MACRGAEGAGSNTGFPNQFGGALLHGCNNIHKILTVRILCRYPPCSQCASMCFDGSCRVLQAICGDLVWDKLFCAALVGFAWCSNGLCLLSSFFYCRGESRVDLARRLSLVSTRTTICTGPSGLQQSGVANQCSLHTRGGGGWNRRNLEWRNLAQQNCTKFHHEILLPSASPPRRESTPSNTHPK